MPAFDVVAWMFKHGHPGYARKIARYQRATDLARAHNAANATNRIARLQKLIETVRSEAYDRYGDWASDPLP